ncbi:aspartate ammonia-lyase, partial [Staphylococcus pseudintermedius]
VTGRPFVMANNLIEATQSTGAYVQVSGVLKRIAVKLSKVCNDLRLLSSGPRAGLNEINLPKMQPGSSIMPGKVNPVIPEVVNQVCFAVIGNCLLYQSDGA